LYYIVKEEIKQLKNNATGVTFGAITISNFDNVKIPLPPLSVQQAIVSECEAIDTAVEKATVAAAAAKAAIEIIINERFKQGTLKKIKDVVDINKLTSDPTTQPDTEFIYVDIESVEKGTGKINYQQKILGINAPSRARRIAPKNSVIISTVRPNLRGFGFIENEINAIYSTGFAILQSKNENELNSKLVYYYFMYSSELMIEISNTMHGGSYPSLNKEDIENIKIPVPPLSDQTALITAIAELEEQIAAHQETIAAAAAQKQAVMKKYL
jgi:restriction endonuclease S subunit